jgi:hypothetical protein
MMALIKAWFAGIPVRLAVFVGLLVIVVFCVAGLAWEAPRLSFVLLASLVGIVWLLRERPNDSRSDWPE